MKRILIHIIGLLQLVLSIKLVIKWLSKPTNAGPLGGDTIILNILLTIVVTVAALLLYLILIGNVIEKLIPVIIACLTVLVIMIGVPIKETIEENKKPIMTAQLGHQTIELFEDQEYEISIRSAEFMHSDRGTYQKTTDKIILDRTIYIPTGALQISFSLMILCFISLTIGV